MLRSSIDYYSISGGNGCVRVARVCVGVTRNIAENWWKIVFPLIVVSVWSGKLFGSACLCRGLARPLARGIFTKPTHARAQRESFRWIVTCARRTLVKQQAASTTRRKKSETMKNYSKGAVILILDVFNIEWKKIKKKNFVYTEPIHTRRGELWHSSINNTSNNAGEKGK